MYIPITENQIQQLKPGDPLIIHGTFKKIYDDGDITFELTATNSRGGVEKDVIYCHPTCVSLPSEPPTLVGSPSKHSPCRKFRKGDKVRVVEWNGRDIARVGQIGYVVSDEYNSRVELTIDGWTKDVFYPACHLELVTPAEELEPYSIETCQYGYTVNKGELILATYNDENHPHAKEAAEAECARLNAEWRKEQK